MPRLNLERLKQHKEESSGLGEMGSTALRYMDRAGRLAGLGVGTLGAAATAPLQLIPGVTDWLPEVDEISNAYKAFTDLRKQGDWDAAISAAQDQMDAGPGYWGLSEIAGSFIPTGGPALAGSKLISAAPKLGRAAPVARGLGQAMRAPWEAEEFVGRQILRPITAGIGGLRGLAARFRGQQAIPDTGEQLRMFPDEVDEILNGEAVIDPIPDTGPIDIDPMAGGTRRPTEPTMTQGGFRDPIQFPEQWSADPVYQGPPPGMSNQERLWQQEKFRTVGQDFVMPADNPIFQAHWARVLKPMTTGKQALLDRLDMEVRLERIPSDVADSASRWINMLPDEYLNDLGSSYIRRIKSTPEKPAEFVLGHHKEGWSRGSPSIITISKQMMRFASDPHRTIIHEISHHLEDFISLSDVRILRNQYQKELQETVTRRGGYLTPEELKETTGLSGAGYRHKAFGEWFAEILTDKALRDIHMKAPEYSSIIGRVLAQIRIMAQTTRSFIEDVLGRGDHAERVYQKLIKGDYSPAERRSILDPNWRTGKWYNTDATTEIRSFTDRGARLAREVPSLFHGTRNINPESLIDANGNLVLRASQNFEGRTIGVSFSESQEVARDYASRVPGQGPTRSRAQGAIFEIDADAIPAEQLFRESGEEIATRGSDPIIIPKGKFRIIKDTAAQTDLGGWEASQIARIKTLPDEGLGAEYSARIDADEVAERARGGEPSARSAEGLSSDIIAKHDADMPQSFPVLDEMVERYRTSANPEQTLASMMRGFTSRIVSKEEVINDIRSQVSSQPLRQTTSRFVQDDPLRGTTSRLARDVPDPREYVDREAQGTTSRLAQDAPGPQMRLDPEDVTDPQMRLFPDVEEVPTGKEVPINKTYKGDVRRGLGSGAGSVASLGLMSNAVNRIGSFLDAVGIRKLDAKNWFAPRTTAISGAVESLFRDVKNIDVQVASHANRMKVWAGENKKVFTLDKDDRILDPALQNKVSGEDIIASPTIQDLVARLDIYADDLTEAQSKFIAQLRTILEEGTSWKSGVDMPGWNQVLREVIPKWDPKIQRGDISGSGFYITRGRAKGGAFGSQGVDESQIIMRPPSRTTSEHMAKAKSMDGAIQTGTKYDSFEDALSQYISKTGDRITGTIGGKEGYIGQRLGTIAARTKAGTTQTAEDIPGMVDYLAGDIAIDDELGKAFQREYQKRALQKPGKKASSVQTLNQVYRSMKATGDLSHLGIQGLLAAYRNFPAWSQSAYYGVKGFIRGSKVEADFIRSFDDAAQGSGMVTSDIWASFGLRIGGTESEYALPGVGRIAEGHIPGIRQLGRFFENANISFGTFGDTLRLGWAQSILKAEIAGGRSLDELIQSGDLKNIADIANKMTGWSDTSFASTTFGADLGNLLLFAPRYFQSRLDTLGRAIEGTARGITPGVNQTIQGREAARAVWSMIGIGTTTTLMINEAFGHQTDVRPLVNGQYNPNFMRIRAGGQDVSLFGTWDSLLRMTVLAAGGVKDPSKISDAYRGMSSGVVRAVWDNLTGYTFTGERTPLNSASPEEIAMYLGDLTLPISFLQAGAPFREAAAGIPDIVRGEEGAMGEAAWDLFGGVGEMTGVKLTPLSRTDRYEEVSVELYGSSYRDLDSDRKEQQVRKVVTERFGEAAHRGPEGPLRQEAVDAENLHQANVAEITQSYLSGEFGVGNWDPKRARREIRISMAEMIDDLDRAYSKLYPGSVREEPDVNTPEHLVWQYEEMFRQNRDSKGRLLYDQLEEAETGFWSKLSKEEVDYVLENIRDTEGLYPQRAQQMRQASRFLNNFKLNIRGENLSYWDLDEHPVVAQRLTRAVAPGISPEHVQRFLISTSTERNGLLQGGERRIFVAIDKEYGKLFRADGTMTALRHEFVETSRRSEFPLWDVVMSTWDYQYPGDDTVRDVIEQWTKDGRFSIDQLDFDALYRQTLGQNNDATLVGR